MAKPRKSILQRLRTRVEAGAALLSVVFPGWAKKIDLRKLDLGNSNTCMLGELYGDYGDGLTELGLQSNDDVSESGAPTGHGKAKIKGNGRIPKGELFGFEVNDSREYSTLTQLWKERVRKALKSRV